MRKELVIQLSNNPHGGAPTVIAPCNSSVYVASVVKFVNHCSSVAIKRHINTATLYF